MNKPFTLLALLLLYCFPAICFPILSDPNSSNINIGVSLHAINEDGSTSLQDGALTLFDTTYNNAVDLNDFRKLNNIAENFAIVKGTAILAIEKRQPLNAADTIFFKMWQMRQKTYQLEVAATNMDNSGNLAFLEDNYLHTSTPLNLSGSTLISFIINTETASADSYRFRIVFKLSVVNTLTLDDNSFKATRQNDQINIDWNSTGTHGTNEYLLEKSFDNAFFQTLASFTNIDDARSFSWADNHPSNGLNYYRIKTVYEDGQIRYSPVERVLYLKNNSAISVFPNPVNTNTVTFLIDNLPQGKYTLSLRNCLGQLINNKDINYAGGALVQNISLLKSLSNGLYQLILSGNAIQPQVVKVLMQAK